MQTLGNIAPSLFNTGDVGITTTILDLVFRDSALLIQDPVMFANPKGSKSKPLESLGLPLIGFTFQQPDTIEFMKFNYAEYPYLNKSVVANAVLKETTNITIKALKPIQKTNPILLNYLTSTALISMIESYARRGGLFMLLTMWGNINNLVLESLSGEAIEGQGGVGFTFTFKKLNFETALEEKSVSSKLDMLLKGAA